MTTTIEQLYTGCLAQGAYYLESEGEAAIIDPMRDIQPYLALAQRRGAKIRYIFETHFHADFVSGHVDLANATGATIVYGPTSMKPGFTCTIGMDGQIFPLGQAKIKLLHTPGHTLESCCYLLYNEADQPTALFTGDTLFIGDVGRPDLAQHVIADLTPEKLASLLFDSLRNKILPLPDDLIIYPGHGAGSACGKNLGTERSDTLGHQKKANYALRDQPRDEFIHEVLNGLTTPPGYFPKDVLLNIQGYEPIDEVIRRGTQPLTVAEFSRAVLDSSVVIIDTRSPEVFCKGFIPGSISVGLRGNFAVWAGTITPEAHQKILLVTDPGDEEEAVVRLARVGFDRTSGFLLGGFQAWQNAGQRVETIESVDASELAKLLLIDLPLLLDVRKSSEFNTQHVVGSVNIPLDYISSSMDQVNKNRTTYVTCAGGYRSVLFISLLRKYGYRNLINVTGGFKALSESGLFQTTELVEVASKL